MADIRKPRITVKPRRDLHAPWEWIGEVWSPAERDAHPARGFMLSVREVENAGTGRRGLIVEVHTADPGVYVRINRRDYKAPR